MRLGLRAIDSRLSERFRQLAKAYPDRVDRELKQMTTEMKSDFEKTTRTWVYKPDFVVRNIRNGYAIGTTDPVWNMIDQGTRAHAIQPVQAPALRWTYPFTAKTKAHTVYSYRGDRGRFPLFATLVRHPGVEAREWTSAIIDRWQPRVAARLRRVLDVVLEAVGL